LARKLFVTPVKLLEAAQLPPQLERTLSGLYEQLDGNGIPGRVGSDLPRFARIIAAVDAFCDLCSNPRAPGGRVDAEKAAQRLREAARRQLFDGEVVTTLCQLAGESQWQRARGHRVLLVDAEIDATMLLEQKLSAMGYEVQTVKTTAEAALAVLSDKVDLILSEVRLQPVDGFAFLERLRTDPRTQDLPFIFVSDRADVEDVNRGFELGALDYIVKPFAPEVLVAKIRRALDQSSGRR
jgi:response regulator RpfG family c-di-GMP phosphodiesterase